MGFVGRNSMRSLTVIVAAVLASTLAVPAAEAAHRKRPRELTTCGRTIAPHKPVCFAIHPR